ncbi:MAG TPA: SDR family NAD(P)-dependent oxidoreductase, partial [Caulobacteraceae bacterium]|nr:SDR family NAD(P)-dependent oxidoreductase [Caulobacteraceae bacterium]
MPTKRVVLVTGATRGIGRAVAAGLAALDQTVIVGGRDLTEANELARELGNKSIGVELDVTKPDTIAAAANHIGTTFTRLDGLVNNAGINV